MGAACKTPAASRSDFVQEEYDKANRQAKEMIRIPNTEVVIMGADGDGGKVVSGSFILAVISGATDLAVLFVGKNFEDMNEGFYYPLLQETPICMSNDKVLTVDAGGGDILAIKFPAGVSDSDLERLMELLASVAAFQVQNPAKKDTVDHVAQALGKGGTILAYGIGRASEVIASGMQAGGKAAQGRITETKHVEVSPATKFAVAGTREATKGALFVSGVVVDGLMSTAVELGKAAGSSAAGSRAGGSRSLAGGADGKEHAAIRLGKAGFLAGAQVFDSLMAAGDKLGTEAAEQTGMVVGKKYGDDAGKVARDGIGIAGDVLSLKDLVSKKVVGRMARKAALYTAKGMAEGVASQGTSSKATQGASSRAS